MNTVTKLFTEANAARLELVVTKLVKAYNSHRQTILTNYKVSEQEVEIIAYLHEHEQQKMKEVGEHFKIKLSTLTSTIDKLEKNRLVKRRNSKHDRRVIFIRPTAKGQTLLTDLLEASREMAEDGLSGLSSAEYESLIKSLENMVEFLSRVD